MQINSQNLNFKGYDALRLKALHIERHMYDEFEPELKEVAKQENIYIRPVYDSLVWAQDNKTFVEEEDEPVMLYPINMGVLYQARMKDEYCYTPKEGIVSYVAGGNSFIGKFPNGQKWMLVGEVDAAKISKKERGCEYGIKPKNIHTIPQQNFHLDMFMRPIGYPYVLVDNPNLVHEKFMNMDWQGHGDEYIQFFLGFEEYNQKRMQQFESHKKVISTLKKIGFVPIEIAGVYGSGINFMNAIVNEHKDGTISYITNGTKAQNPFIASFQEEFEKDLREHVPNIDRVYFVNGSTDENRSYMMSLLNTFSGGVHCLTTEEPDFEAWG